MKGTKGRPAGSKNIKTEQWEEFAEFMLTAGLEKFRTEILTLEGKQYCDTILNAMEFHKPKLSRVDGKVDGDHSVEVIIKHDYGDSITKKLQGAVVPEEPNGSST